ncbi:MAG: ATP-binding protein, partial [Deltaproteobacteria bacterium]|nr:ATP-binding protein [Deltaproteobacteria bacterium]
RVCILAEPDGELVRITIEDDGPGVESQLRERIFDPFFTTRPPGAGLGLGLFLARRIAHSLGGDLTLADSAKGARFMARLPRLMPVFAQSQTNYEQLRVYGR